MNQPFQCNPGRITMKGILKKERGSGYDYKTIFSDIIDVFTDAIMQYIGMRNAQSCSASLPLSTQAQIGVNFLLYRRAKKHF